jgi:hypothetical protein
MKLSSISLSVALTMTTSSTMRSASAFIPHQQRAAVLPTGGATRAFLFDKLFSTSSGKLPVMAEEDVMSPKAHGTSEKPVQKNLRWNCDFDTADRICNFNRTYSLDDECVGVVLLQVSDKFNINISILTVSTLSHFL